MARAAQGQLRAHREWERVDGPGLLELAGELLQLERLGLLDGLVDEADGVVLRAMKLVSVARARRERVDAPCRP